MTRSPLFRTAALGLLLAAGLALAADKPDSVPEIGPTGPVKKEEGKYAFTEGPAPDADGNVYFSDIPNKKVHKIGPGGTVTVLRENSNSANGLMVNAKGEVVACEM